MMRWAVRILLSLTLMTLCVVVARTQEAEIQIFTIVCDANSQIYVEGALTPLEELTGLLEQRMSLMPPGRRQQLEVQAHLNAPPKVVESAVQAAIASLPNRPQSLRLNKSTDQQTAIWIIYELPPNPEAGGMPPAGSTPNAADPKKPARRDETTDRGQPLRVGGDVLQSKLIKKVEPVYPELAKQNRISGLVLLMVTIDEKGYVQSIQVVRGHPGLNVAAMMAVSQWEYTPTLLNGEPVPVQATVTVNFTLR